MIRIKQTMNLDIFIRVHRLFAKFIFFRILVRTALQVRGLFVRAVKTYEVYSDGGLMNDCSDMNNKSETLKSKTKPK